MSKLKPSIAKKIERMREAYVGFEGDDLEIFLAILRDDAVWHSQLSGTDLKGKAAIRTALHRVVGATDQYKVGIHDIVANDDHMVVLETHNARFKSGITMHESPSTAVYHLDDEGYVTEVWPILDTALWKKALGM